MTIWIANQEVISSMVIITWKFKECPLLLFTSCSAAWILKSLLFHLIIRYSGRSSLCNLFYPLPFIYANWLFFFSSVHCCKDRQETEVFSLLVYFFQCARGTSRWRTFNRFLSLCQSGLKHFYSEHQMSSEGSLKQEQQHGGRIRWAYTKTWATRLSLMQQWEVLTWSQK